MASWETTKAWLLVLVLLVAKTYYGEGEPQAERQVPCVFAFGDSLTDSGNNNNLRTSAKANYQPYGIDFPNGSTGRFSNGLTVFDIIAQLLGFETFIGPFANRNSSGSESDILKGVNYASGGAGIRDDTGRAMGEVISLGSQIRNHGIIVSRIMSRLGDIGRAKEYLGKCLYYFSIGANDYINNYFVPQNYTTSRIYTPQQYAVSLNQLLSLYLKNLHDVYGARKFVVFGIGSIGCLPRTISMSNGSSCVEEQNRAAQLFNERLRLSIDELNQNYTDSRFIFVNTTAISSADSRLTGFLVVNAPCCPTNSDGLCIPNGIPCQNRSQYIFFDEFHPTEPFNRIVAHDSYNDPDGSFTHPMDINQLARSQL
ncbi:hypothetical protein L6164_035397 [Bauhinia variegata]|uniref:Uncharacterized protein n=1 Tax=Bauhinia variegata TaxID=167791 RepID=A0ACB9KDU2_BAUVA|nr:hypothetical protein L6164_035397 [Bauhinia variegata]